MEISFIPINHSIYSEHLFSRNVSFVPRFLYCFRTPISKFFHYLRLTFVIYLSSCLRTYNYYLAINFEKFFWELFFWHHILLLQTLSENEKICPSLQWLYLTFGILQSPSNLLFLRSIWKRYILKKKFVHKNFVKRHVF